jgi:uncharacterized protein YndB with AHSA1/START domain
VQNDAHIITQEITIPVPVKNVWKFLMSESNMKSWFEADEFVIDIIEGGKIEIPLSIGGDECHIEGEIGLILPMEKFAFTWIERDSSGDAWFNNTTVTFRLEEKKNKTHFTLIHDGFKYLPEDQLEDIFERYQTFWKEGRLLKRFRSLILEQSNQQEAQ